MNILIKLILTLSVLVVSCTVPVQQVNTGIEHDYSGENLFIPDVRINKLVVIPAFFKQGIVDNTTESYRKKKQDLVSSMVYDEIAIRKIFRELVPFFKTMEVFNELKEQTDQYGDVSNLRDVAMRLGADKMFVTRISRYDEREGSEMGVEQPASVSFTNELYEVESGQLIWRHIYSETQEPLLQDVSKIKKFVERGGKWISADQLAKEGIEISLSKLQTALENQK